MLLVLYLTLELQIKTRAVCLSISKPTKKLDSLHSLQQLKNQNLQELDIKLHLFAKKLSFLLQ